MTKCVGNMRPYKKGVGGFDKILMLLLYFDQNHGDDNALLDKGPTKSACCLGISIWLIHLNLVSLFQVFSFKDRSRYE